MPSGTSPVVPASAPRTWVNGVRRSTRSSGATAACSSHRWRTATAAMRSSSLAARLSSAWNSAAPACRCEHGADQIEQVGFRVVGNCNGSDHALEGFHERLAAAFGRQLRSGGDRRGCRPQLGGRQAGRPARPAARFPARDRRRTRARLPCRISRMRTGCCAVTPSARNRSKRSSTATTSSSIGGGSVRACSVEPVRHDLPEARLSVKHRPLALRRGQQPFMVHRPRFAEGEPLTRALRRFSRIS